MPGFQAVNRHIRDLKEEMAELRTLLPSLLSPANTEPTSKRATVRRDRRAEGRIIDAMIEVFDLQELEDLALDVGVNYQAILGEGLRGKAMGLVSHFARHGRLDLLVNQLATERPHIDWHGALLDTNELK